MSGPEPTGDLYGARVIGREVSLATVADLACGMVLDPGPRWRFRIALALAVALAVVCVAVGGDVPGAFVNAVADWWLGIASGSLLVACVLHLSETEWRCAIARLAQSCAVIGGVTAAFTSAVGLAGSSKAALTLRVLDSTDVAALLVVAFSVWLVGLAPDLAPLGARAGPTRRGALYRALALGWRGSVRQWRIRGEAGRVLAVLACLLVAALETDRALRLAESAPAGQDASLLPVRTFAGAVLAGAGITAALAATLRTLCRFEALITVRHLDILARLILVLGLASLYAHIVEIGAQWLLAPASALRPLTAPMVIAGAGLLAVQLFWFTAARQSAVVLTIVGLLVALGDLADRIAMLPLEPSGPAAGPIVMLALAGIGIAGALMLLALRLLPAIAIAATRTLVLLHNPERVTDALPAADERPDAEGPPKTLFAAFATDSSLVAVARTLSDRTAAWIDALGPVPIEIFEERSRRPAPIHVLALASAVLGGLAFLIAAAWLADGRTPLAILHTKSIPVVWLLPAICMATACGALATALATGAETLRAFRRAARRGIPALPRADEDRFYLVAGYASEDELDRVMARLAALPAESGRPLAIWHFPHGERSSRPVHEVLA